MHLIACILLLCGPLSVPSTWSLVGVKIILISPILLFLMKLICMMKGEVNWSFLWVYSFFPPLSLSVALVFPPSVFPFCFRFTVYSNTAGCTEALGMKSRLISDGQLSASSSFRTWGIDTFTWHPQFARLDKQGKTNAWSPSHNNRSEWIQVREILAVKCPLKPTCVAEYNCFLCFFTRSI